MPYENEKANPTGYTTLLNSETVLERLHTFAGYSREVEEEIAELLPVREAALLESEVSSTQVEHIVTVDGSYISVKTPQPRMEVGFIKIGVVTESLRRLRALQASVGPLPPTAVDDCYKSYSVEFVLPGRGVVDAVNGVGGADKLRQEIYASMELLDVDPKRVFRDKTPCSLMDVFVQLSQSGFMNVECSICHKKNSVGVEPEVCPECNLGVLRISDALRLHDLYQRGKDKSSEMAYSEAMSYFERLLMTGLLLKAGKAGDKAVRRTAFITDGPLALFRSEGLAPLLLELLQDLPSLMIAGFEKTGQFVEFANHPSVQRVLHPGCVGMVNTTVAAGVVGRSSSRAYGEHNFYGRRFFYRTLRGDKTFVFALPPRSGPPSGKDVEWSNYPTLRTFCELIEETQTDVFGSGSASITSVAQANTTASIPKFLGERMLNELLQNVTVKHTLKDPSAALLKTEPLL